MTVSTNRPMPRSRPYKSSQWGSTLTPPIHAFLPFQLNQAGDVSGQAETVSTRRANRWNPVRMFCRWLATKPLPWDPEESYHSIDVPGPYLFLSPINEDDVPHTPGKLKLNTEPNQVLDGVEAHETHRTIFSSSSKKSDFTATSGWRLSSSGESMPLRYPKARVQKGSEADGLNSYTCTKPTCWCI